MQPFVAGVLSMEDRSQAPEQTRRYTPGMKRALFIIGGIVLAVAIAVGMLVFKPWLLFVDVRVDDALPTVTQPPVAATPTADRHR